MKKSPTLEMYDYNVWANKVMINHLNELPKDIYHHDIQSGFTSISQVLTHIYLVEQAWFDISAGQSMNEAMTMANQLQKQIESKEIQEMETSMTTYRLNSNHF